MSYIKIKLLKSNDFICYMQLKFQKKKSTLVKVVRMKLSLSGRQTAVLLCPTFKGSVIVMSYSTVNVDIDHQQSE